MRCFILILICDDRLSTRVWQKWNIWNFLGKFFYRKWVIWLHFLAQSPIRYLEIKTGLTFWKFCMMIKYYNQTKVKYVKFSILGPGHCNFQQMWNIWNFKDKYFYWRMGHFSMALGLKQTSQLPKDPLDYDF